MIRVEGVSFRYRTGGPVLKDINLEFPRDTVSALLGLSGSGKTTLLMCLGRFYRPQEGQITLDGRPILELPEDEFRRRVGIVFQQLYLFPHLRVIENMTLAMIHAMDAPRAQADQEARKVLERLGIGELAESYPAQISGGQAQRAAIARALLLKPDYLLLDEPTSALDAQTTGDFADWLKGLRDQTNFIIVTHDLPFARRVAQTGHYMSEGRLEASGDMERIASSVLDGSSPEGS